MTDETAAMRAWLATHGLVDAELLHLLPNHGPEGGDRLTDAERQLLSALLETRRTVVPGYRPAPCDRPTTPDWADPAELVGLFDPGSRPLERAAGEPTSRHARPAGAAGGSAPAAVPPGRRPAHRYRDEERER